MNCKEQRPCEIIFSCPYYRRTVFFKTDTTKSKRKKKSEERKPQEIARIAHYCVFKKERTEITSENRHRIHCYYDEILNLVR